MTAPCASCGLLHSVTDTDPACAYECHPDCGPDLRERGEPATWYMSRYGGTISGKAADPEASHLPGVQPDPNQPEGAHAMLPKQAEPEHSATTRVRIARVTPTHSCRCGARWTGQAICHCASCHLTFSSLTAFEKHRLSLVCQAPETRGLVARTRKTARRSYVVWGNPSSGWAHGDESEDA